MYFLLLGPFAGSFGFVLTDQLAAVAGFSSTFLIDPENFTSLWGSVPILWLYSLVLAYPVGAMPALLCGLVYEWLLKNNPSTTVVARSILGATIGSSISIILGSLFVYNSNSGNMMIHILPWGIAGLFGGLVSAFTTNYK